VLTGAQANEAALKSVRSPRILHIATHGFFLPDRSGDNTSALGKKDGREALQARGEDNPMLRSGLILAGVKQRESGKGEDGVLTAQEACLLDLWGTKLVVLSACETGLGETQAGEGVYGLRRALVLAGSESQVMSLWKVSDETTRDFMSAYYARLVRGEGRTEALRHAQLEMLKSSKGIGDIQDKLQHPFYWAAFIQSGDWRRMNATASENK
jgi:CHAT domain-containing protein